MYHLLSRIPQKLKKFRKLQAFKKFFINMPLVPYNGHF